MTPSVPCPSARVLRSLRSREVTPSTYLSQKRSQILLNRLRRRLRPPPLRKFASHAPNLRKQHECAVYVVPDYGQTRRNQITSCLPTIRQAVGQFWGCERKGDFSIVVPLGGKRRDSQRKKVLNSPRNRQTSSLSVEAQTLYGLFFTLFRRA